MARKGEEELRQGRSHALFNLYIERLKRNHNARRRNKDDIAKVAESDEGSWRQEHNISIIRTGKGGEARW